MTNIFENGTKVYTELTSVSSKNGYSFFQGIKNIYSHFFDEDKNLYYILTSYPISIFETWSKDLNIPIKQLECLLDLTIVSEKCVLKINEDIIENMKRDDLDLLHRIYVEKINE